MKPNKHIIDQSIKLAGHLIPLDERLNSHQFSKLIKARFSLCNPITNKIYMEVSESIELYYKRSLDGVKVTKI